MNSKVSSLCLPQGEPDVTTGDQGQVLDIGVPSDTNFDCIQVEMNSDDISSLLCSLNELDNVPVTGLEQVSSGVSSFFSSSRPEGSGSSFHSHQPEAGSDGHDGAHVPSCSLPGETQQSTKQSSQLDDIFVLPQIDQSASKTRKRRKKNPYARVLTSSPIVKEKRATIKKKNDIAQEKEEKKIASIMKKAEKAREKEEKKIASIRKKAVKAHKEEEKRATTKKKVAKEKATSAKRRKKTH